MSFKSILKATDRPNNQNRLDKMKKQPETALYRTDCFFLSFHNSIINQNGYDY